MPPTDEPCRHRWRTPVSCHRVRNRRNGRCARAGVAPSPTALRPPAAAGRRRGPLAAVAAASCAASSNRRKRRKAPATAPVRNAASPGIIPAASQRRNSTGLAPALTNLECLSAGFRRGWRARRRETTVGGRSTADLSLVPGDVQRIVIQWKCVLKGPLLSEQQDHLLGHRKGARRMLDEAKKTVLVPHDI